VKVRGTRSAPRARRGQRRCGAAATANNRASRCGLPAGLHRSGAPPERTAAQLGVGALVGKSVLHVDGESTPQGVEPVDRIARHEGQAIDGSFRDEVPVHGIAKNLVDPHSVLIDGQTLWGADDRRGDEPAVVDVALELIAGLVAKRDTGQTARYCIQQVGCLRMLEVAGRKCLDVGGDLVAIDQAGIDRGRRGFSGRGRGDGAPSRSGSGAYRRRSCRARCRPRTGGSHRRVGDDPHFRKTDILGKNRVRRHQRGKGHRA
jgi:hypothetical protein